MTSTPSYDPSRSSESWNPNEHNEQHVAACKGEMEGNIQQVALPTNSMLLNNLLGNPRALVTQIGCLMLLIPLIMVVTANPAGLNASHPPLQTIALLMFAQGVLTLQPTTTKNDKARGLTLHAIFQIVGLALTVAGNITMMVSRSQRRVPHFHSLHGRMGLATMILLILQSIMGMFIACDPGMRLLGGQSSAKSFWKYHRALGYTILPITIVTTATAVTKTKFVTNHSTTAEQSLMIAGLAFIAAGLWSGVNPRKLGWKLN